MECFQAAFPAPVALQGSPLLLWARRTLLGFARIPSSNLKTTPRQLQPGSRLPSRDRGAGSWASSLLFPGKNLRRVMQHQAAGDRLVLSQSEHLQPAGQRSARDHRPLVQRRWLKLRLSPKQPDTLERAGLALPQPDSHYSRCCEKELAEFESRDH